MAAPDVGVAANFESEICKLVEVGGRCSTRRDVVRSGRIVGYRDIESSFAFPV
jgi:hypothetical protein